MHDKSAEDWWEIRVKGIVVTTVVSGEGAVWFFEKLKPIDVNAKWELVSVERRPLAEPIKPSQARKRKVQYCIGSD